MLILALTCGYFLLQQNLDIHVFVSQKKQAFCKFQSLCSVYIRPYRPIFLSVKTTSQLSVVAYAGYEKIVNICIPRF